MVFVSFSSIFNNWSKKNAVGKKKVILELLIIMLVQMPREHTDHPLLKRVPATKSPLICNCYARLDLVSIIPIWVQIRDLVEEERLQDTELYFE
jgi:hypothetical protein